MAQQCLQSTEDPLLSKRAYYNQGVELEFLGRLEESKRAFELAGDCAKDALPLLIKKCEERRISQERRAEKREATSLRKYNPRHTYVMKEQKHPVFWQYSVSKKPQTPKPQN